MAVTNTVVDRGNKQFQGLFSEMWLVKATVDPASVASGATTDTFGSDTVTVPGLVLGDVVVAFAPGVDVGNLQIQCHVTAADTITIQYANGTNGAIDLASSVWRFLIGKLINQ